jgi:hypothetical protein
VAAGGADQVVLVGADQVVLDAGHVGVLSVISVISVWR